MDVRLKLLVKIEIPVAAVISDANDRKADMLRQGLPVDGTLVRADVHTRLQQHAGAADRAFVAVEGNNTFMRIADILAGLIAVEDVAASEI